MAEVPSLHDTDTIEVPAEYVENSCGFSLDIGGSVAKLVYRSSEDYKDAKPLKDFGKFNDGRVKGRLRLVLVPKNQIDLVIDYVKNHWDMTSHDGVITINTTGVGGNFFREKLQKELGIKTKNVFESDCFVKAFSLLRDILPHEEFVTPLPPNALVMKSFEDISKTGNTQNSSSGVNDLSLEDKEEKKGKKENLNNNSLIMMCGSAFGMLLTDAVMGDSKHNFVEIISKGGISFLGLGRLMTGLDNYDDMMALIETADGKSCNILAGDFKSSDSSTDVPTLMPDDFPIIPFGKAVGVPREKLNKGDLLYSLLTLICTDMCEMIYLICVRNGLHKVYFVGNFVKHPITQEFITMQLNMKNLGMPPGRKPIDFQFVKNGGHFGALGAYIGDSFQTNLQK